MPHLNTLPPPLDTALGVYIHYTYSFIHSFIHLTKPTWNVVRVCSPSNSRTRTCNEKHQAASLLICFKIIRIETSSRLFNRIERQIVFSQQSSYAIWNKHSHSDTILRAVSSCRTVLHKFKLNGCIEYEMLLIFTLYSPAFCIQLKKKKKTASPSKLQIEGLGEGFHGITWLHMSSFEAENMNDRACSFPNMLDEFDCGNEHYMIFSCISRNLQSGITRN